MSLKYRLRLLIVTFAYISSNVLAQTYNFKNFNIEEGLSQSHITDIIQDSRGYLWIGTAGGGICKFDGANFTQYSEKDGIAGNIITGISEDNKGNIWLTSTWGGVTKYNGQKFSIYSKSNGYNIDNNNQNIFTDYIGKVWISNTLGISIYSKDKFVPFAKSNSNSWSKDVNFISQDSKKRIWIGTNNGIIVISESDTLRINSNNGLPCDKISSFIEDHQGNFWIGTKTKGIVKILNKDLNKSSRYLFKVLMDEEMAVTSIIKDKDKTIWFSTDKHGIFHVKKDNSLSNITTENGLITNSISKIFKDKSGNLWIGTIGAGLTKMENATFTYFDRINGLNDHKISNIIQDNTNNIWVSTMGNGIFKYNGETSIQYSNESKYVHSSLKDNNGDLWFATKNGLLLFKNGVFKRFTTKNGLPENQIKALTLDNENNLWIGTNSHGVVKYNHSKFITFNKENNGLPDNCITTLFKDAKGNIWIGTIKGITQFNGSTFSDYSEVSKVQNSYIQSICEDKYHNIWIGTNRSLIKYNHIFFESITINNGLSSNLIYLTHFSSRGNLWIGTNKGIDKITFNNYGDINEIKNYGLIEGFRGVECNNNAIYEDKIGNLWIGTVKGLVKYNPSEDRENVYEPSIHIDNIRLSFENVNWNKYTNTFSDWNHLPLNLNLNYNENHLTFDFSAINLTHPEYLQYSFKLDGFDNDWYPNTTKKSATYSNLPHGDYTFMVKARNNNGVWSQMPAQFSFSISSPYWKTWWFYVLLTFLIFYTIFKISFYREKRQLIISRELEEKIKERTHLIEKQRDEKEILLKEIHHRVKNNMQVVNSLLSIQSSYTKDEKAIALFDEAKNRIRSMALIHEKMYQSGDLAKINFQDYITTLTDDLISTYSIGTKISLDIKIDNIKFGIDTLIPLGLLLNEIISNALKYAFIGKEKGKVIVHLNFNEEENIYTLITGDDGVGMKENVASEDNDSLGMDLIDVFVEQIEGKISKLKDQGTIYKIEFKPE